jgi:hypothetical protein
MKKVDLLGPLNIPFEDPSFELVHFREKRSFFYWKELLPFSFFSSPHNLFSVLIGCHLIMTLCSPSFSFSFPFPYLCFLSSSPTKYGTNFCNITILIKKRRNERTMPLFVLKFECFKPEMSCKNHFISMDELFLCFQHCFVSLDENTP